MDIKNIKREDGKLSFQVIVDPETFEKAVNQAYEVYVKQNTDAKSGATKKVAVK